MTRWLVRLAIVVLLGVILAVVAYPVTMMLTNPGPRDSEGWTLLATLPTARGETAAAVAADRLYVIGGLTGLGFEASDEVSVYEPAGNAWQAGPPLPAARHHAAAVGLDGTVYVTGGGSADGAPQETLWALPTGAGGWQVHTPMPEERLGHRMLAIGGRLYVVGGIGGTGRVLVYDPATQTWSAAAEMPSPRDHIAAVAVENEIWVIGGRSDGRNHARVDIYDPVADTWHEGPPLPEGTSGASDAILDGVIYISGGEDPAVPGPVIDRHWQLDTRQGEKATWEPMLAPPFAVHGAHGAAIDEAFLIVGGALRQGAFSRFAWTGATQAYEPP
ncbi:MAG TPA: kelch repeat-containing protein [Candidatus Dormibacteraeota bacterium]|nr:kelch repeat-containing protein [Candidatus Dormibacteraeota bacterium]